MPVSPTVTPGAPVFNGRPVYGRSILGGGTAVAAADFAAAAGFGNTATVTVAAGSTDTRGRIDVASAGTGQGANPTVVLTFKDGAFDSVPFVTCSRSDTSAAAGYWAVTARTTTTVTFTFVGTPVAGQTYTLSYCVHP